MSSTPFLDAAKNITQSFHWIDELELSLIDRDSARSDDEVLDQAIHYAEKAQSILEALGYTNDTLTHEDAALISESINLGVMHLRKGEISAGASRLQKIVDYRSFQANLSYEEISCKDKSTPYGEAKI